MVGAGYLSAICTTPPNPSPSPKDRHKTDRISFVAGSYVTFIRRTAVTVITYHALLTVVPDYAPAHVSQFCPHPQNPTPSLFTWNPTTVACLLAIYIGAFVRLSAFGGLGRHFTFHLAAPDELVTTGIYRWVQHPSYLGQALISVACTVLFVRWDGAPACWIAGSTLTRWDGVGFWVAAAFMGFGLWVLVTRVRDEEEMLRQTFGKKWEEWHRKTSRAIPYIF